MSCHTMSSLSVFTRCHLFNIFSVSSPSFQSYIYIGNLGHISNISNISSSSLHKLCIQHLFKHDLQHLNDAGGSFWVGRVTIVPWALHSRIKPQAVRAVWRLTCSAPSSLRAWAAKGTLSAMHEGQRLVFEDVVAAVDVRQRVCETGLRREPFRRDRHQRLQRWQVQRQGGHVRRVGAAQGCV